MIINIFKLFYQLKISAANLFIWLNVAPYADIELKPDNVSRRRMSLLQFI